MSDTHVALMLFLLWLAKLLLIGAVAYVPIASAYLVWDYRRDRRRRQGKATL